MSANLENIITAFTPQNDKERFSQDALTRLLPALPRCLYRDHFDPGHITGSGFLVSADGQRILLNHHKFLNMWLHFGGHADGNDDILNVAQREVEEESGLSDFTLAYDGILSIDVHDIPASKAKQEPAHKHFDVIFLFRLNEGADEAPQISDESIKLKWASWNDLAQFSLEPHLQSALDKAHKILKDIQADVA